jgi:hypothetical protein
MLFDAILTVVFEKIHSFQPHENYSWDLFRAFFAQKVVFGKVTFGPFGVFVRVFNSVQLSQQERQDSQLSGEKTERS